MRNANVGSAAVANHRVLIRHRLIDPVPGRPSHEDFRRWQHGVPTGPWQTSGQKIHVGIRHTGQTLTVRAADATFRIYDQDQLVADVARTRTKPIARFKVRKPESLRGPAHPPHKQLTAPRKRPRGAVRARSHLR